MAKRFGFGLAQFGSVWLFRQCMRLWCTKKSSNWITWFSSISRKIGNYMYNHMIFKYFVKLICWKYCKTDCFFKIIFTTSISPSKSSSLDTKLSNYFLNFSTSSLFSDQLSLNAENFSRHFLHFKISQISLLLIQLFRPAQKMNYFCLQHIFLSEL